MKKILAFGLCMCILVLVTAYFNQPNTSKENNPVTEAVTKYCDGTYRGGYIDPEQVEVEFVIKDNKFESMKYRV